MAAWALLSETQHEGLVWAGRWCMLCETLSPLKQTPLTHVCGQG